MKFSIETNHVFVDLKALQTFDINAYGRASALVRELHANQGTAEGQALIDQLNMQGRDMKIGPQMICNSLQIEHERLKRNLWRLKIWRIDDKGKQILEPYRLIYGFFSVNQFRKIPEIRLFAVPCRAHEKDDSYDYKPEHPISVRVRSAYDAYE